MLCNMSFWQTRGQDDIKLSKKLKTFSALVKNIDTRVTKADIYGNEGEENKGEDQQNLLKPCASSSQCKQLVVLSNVNSLKDKHPS